MRTYIEAYRADGSQILGNLDGQTSRDVRDIKRTHLYKALVSGKGRPKWVHVKHWCVFQGTRILTWIPNIHYREGG